VQTTADNASRLITPCGVTDCPNGFHCLKENLNTPAEQLDTVPKTCLADAGYANEEQIKNLEREGIECTVPFHDESEIKKIRRDSGLTFTYDQESGCFKCSRGKCLLPVGKNCKKKSHLYSEQRIVNS
jgi:hypothetical protein